MIRDGQLPDLSSVDLQSAQALFQVSKHSGNFAAANYLLGQFSFGDQFIANHFEVATGQCDLELMHILIQHKGLQVTDPKILIEALMDGLTQKRVGALNLLLEHGMKITQLSPNLVKGTDEDETIELLKLLKTSGLDLTSNFTVENNIHINLLTSALAQGKIKVAKYLMSEGCNVTNAKEVIKFTELQEAILKEDVANIKYLISGGVNINQGTKDNLTAAHYAAAVGNQEILRLLADHDCDFNVTTKQNLITPMFYAFSSPNPKGTFDFILEQNVNVGKPIDRYDSTALTHAISTGNDEIVFSILDDTNSRLNYTDLWGSNKSPLMLSLWRGRRDIIERLISRGDDISQASDTLVEALRIQDFNLAKQLIEAGIALDYTPSYDSGESTSSPLDTLSNRNVDRDGYLPADFCDFLESLIRE